MTDTCIWTFTATAVVLILRKNDLTLFKYFVPQKVRALLKKGYEKDPSKLGNMLRAREKSLAFVFFTSDKRESLSIYPVD